MSIGGMSLKDEKMALRKTLRTKLSEMDDEHIQKCSIMVADKVFALPEYRNARGVACFVSMPKEFNTRRLLEGICADGKALYLPRVESVKEKTMSMLRYVFQNARNSSHVTFCMTLAQQDLTVRYALLMFVFATGRSLWQTWTRGPKEGAYMHI
jgi:5,10-methenyltetrahydrofolate synthetase